MEYHQIADIKKALKQLLIPQGFTQQGNLFCKIQGDLAFCVNVERPGLSHVNYFILPLYLPHTGLTLTYGNRFVFADTPISEAGICTVLADVILPFLEEVPSTQAVLGLLKNRQRTIRKYFFCSTFELDRLRAYTALRLGDGEAFLKAMCKAKRSLSAAQHYTPSVREGFLRELSELENAAELSLEQQSLWFDEITKNTLQCCFPAEFSAST